MAAKSTRLLPYMVPSAADGKIESMTHTQSTILLIEVGIIALLMALGYLPKRP